MENDTDSVNISSVNADDIDIAMGNGDDLATVQFSTIADDLDIDVGYEYSSSGQDDDRVSLFFNTIHDDIEVKGRDGNDTVSAGFNSADEVDFNGGSGFDEFFSYYGANGQDSNDFDDLDLFSAYTEHMEMCNRADTVTAYARFEEKSCHCLNEAVAFILA